MNDDEKSLATAVALVAGIIAGVGILTGIAFWAICLGLAAVLLAATVALNL